MHNLFQFAILRLKLSVSWAQLILTQVNNENDTVFSVDVVWSIWFLPNNH
jgi:hypothetical protein